MNDNLALEIIDEEVETQGFVIDDDVKAEWAIKKIAEERAETQRYINICDTMIQEYEFKKQQAIQQSQNKTSGLISMLQQYFEKVPHKATKTQETYKLPSGQLKLKIQAPEYVRDDTTLLNWIKSREDTFSKEFIKIKESADWSKMKKEFPFIAKGSVLTTADGEIIDGVTVVERSPIFEVEV